MLRSSVGRSVDRSLFSLSKFASSILSTSLLSSSGDVVIGKSFFTHAGLLRVLYLLNCSSLDCEQDNGRDLDVGFTLGSEFFAVFARLRRLGFL